MEYLNNLLKSSLSYLSTFNYTKKKIYTVEDVKELVCKLNDVKEKIILRVGQLETKHKDCLIDAKNKHVKKMTHSAILSLRLSKMYETEKNRLEKMVFNIETCTIDVESMELMLTTSDILKLTNDHMNKYSNLFDLKKIENMMDELSECKNISSEILDTVSHPMDSINDDALILELDKLNVVEEPKNNCIPHTKISHDDEAPLLCC